MRKILLMGNCEGLGGAQTALRQFASFLTTQDVRVSVVGICNKSDELAAIPASGFRCQLHMGPSTMNGRLQRGWEVVKSLVKSKTYAPDIFVTVGLTTSGCYIARVLGKKTFKVCQDFIHGRSIDDPLLKANSSVFDAVAVQSPKMQQIMRDQGFSRRGLMWLPCFPEPPVDNIVREPRENNGSIRLGYFGRLASNKGVDVLLRAMAGSKIKDSVDLDIWGEGPESSTVDACRKELDLGSRVQMRGRYPSNREYATLLCSYDAIVLPSQSREGLPLVLLEAMAYGVPFLATNIGAISDCCAGNLDAILTEPDEDSLARGLDELASRIVARSFSSERLRDFYNRMYSTRVMGLRWMQFIDSPTSFVGNNDV